jgi:hypothetical protein
MPPPDTYSHDYYLSHKTKWTDAKARAKAKDHRVKHAVTLESRRL